jgi:GTP cyclohydrolase II
MTYDHAETPFRNRYGDATFHCFSWGENEQDNVLALVAGPPSDVPLVRVQSACYTAEIFRSTDCDCHEQLDRSLTRVHREGGVVIYMLCDGRGAGLLTKVRALALNANQGLDTAAAYEHLGVTLDPRDYERAATALGALGLTDIRLLTNNPRKLDGLAAAGLRVTREPLIVEPTPDSKPYLLAKQQKLGHLLGLAE